MHINMIDILLIACSILFFSFYIRTAQKLRNLIRESNSRSSACIKFIYIVAMLLIFFAVGIVKIPIPIFYLLLYGADCIPKIAIKEGKSQEWLFTNVGFLAFASPHLIVVGLLALCAQTDVVGVFEDFTLLMLSLVIVLLLNVIALPVLINYLSTTSLDKKSTNKQREDKEELSDDESIALSSQSFSRVRLRALYWGAEEFKLFLKFVWLCVCSVIFDSIPCLFPLPTIYPLIFLIGSNLLLLLMAFLFARHVYIIMCSSFLKEESIRIQKEAMEQHLRTIKLEREAYIDVLTKVYNRQYVITNADNMLINGEAFILAFLDLDKLKQINDLQGHLAGDAYLQNFSDHMKKRLRPNDIFARYGGDEFLILMPDVSLEFANAQLNSIQSDATLQKPEGWGIPFSYGLVSARPDLGINTEKWIAMADRAMYNNKINRQGKRWG